MIDLMKIFRGKIVIALISFFIGIAAGSTGLHLWYQRNPTTSFAVREGGYTFINPLLSCDISENKEFKEYKPLNDKITAYINESITNGDAQKVSVYFRGLNSGHWAGVNENEKYSPASLLKVPILIAYLKFAELQPGLLDKTITYSDSVDENAVEEIKPTKAIQNGGVYSIADLLKYMIVYSDNNAMKFLQEHLDQNSLNEVYSDVGIIPPKNLTDETVSAKDYSYMFRLLYNGTYLSKTMSQYALELLSGVDFKDGLRAGMPSQTIVSQKFGERTVNEENPATGSTQVLFRELHDCGIVYNAENPYLVCVMTKGGDFKKLSKVISTISNIVYTEVNTEAFKF